MFCYNDNMIKWKLISGTPDYISDNQEYIAVYKDSYRGYGNYWVFPANLPKGKRIMRNALSVGGLPERKYW